MTTYNSDATAGNEVVVRKVVVPLIGGSAPPTVGQIWPRGSKA